MIHFCGDLHQPLHCADRDDKGGNAIPILLRNATKPTNLHSVWDSAMLKTYMGSKGVTDYANSLSAKISKEDAKAWALGTAADWANETHAIAAKDVYGDLPPVTKDPIHLDSDYITSKRPIIEQQLERGGVRLAAVLNKAFSASGK